MAGPAFKSLSLPSIEKNDEQIRLRMNAHFRVLKLLAEDAPLEEILTVLTEGAEEARPEMFCSVCLLDPGKRVLRHAVAPSLPEFYNEAIDGFPVGPKSGSCGAAAALGQRVIVTDISSHPNWEAYKNLAREAGLRSCWSEPILSSRGQVLGTFAMYYTEPRAPDQADIDFIQTNAQIAALAIEQKRTADALRTSENKYRTIVENAPMCIHELDLEGKMISINRSGLTMMGLKSQNEIIGQEMLGFVAEEDFSRVQALLGQAFHGHQSQFEFKGMLGPSPRYFSSCFIPIKDNALSVVKILSVCKEITPEKIAEQNLNVRANELAYSNTELEEFASILAHEVQEPLQSIAKLKEALPEKKIIDLSEEARSSLVSVINGANHLKNTVDDLIDYLALSTEEQKLVPCDFNEIVDSAQRILKNKIDEDSADVYHQNLPSLSVDHDQFVNVFKNLIDNAIKFNRGLKPEIQISAISKSDGWEFCIQDNGQGIESQNKEKIFSLSERLHHHDHVEGTGIGLAIVRKIIHEHGGKIWVESVLKEGSKFFFTIPKVLDRSSNN